MAVDGTSAYHLQLVPDFHRDQQSIGQDIMGQLRRYLSFNDPAPFWFDLGVAASAFIEDGAPPVWGMTVGASGSGKSEGMKIVTDLANDRVNYLTEPGLLGRDPKGRLTGLLPQLPHPALVLINDYSTMLAGDSRDKGFMQLTAALRDVYDGSYSRHLGKERPLRWEGHVTFLANCTDAIDSHATYSTHLGPRWVYLRMARRDFGAKLRSARTSRQAERDRARSAARVLANVLVPVAIEHGQHAELPEWVAERLDEATTVTSYGRAHVERDSYRRDITGVVSDEDPTRLNQSIQKLARVFYAGFDLAAEDVLYLGRRLAADSMPGFRRAVLVALSNSGRPVTMPDVARSFNAAYPKSVSRALFRTAEELETLGVVQRVGEMGRGDDGRFGATEWGLVPEFDAPVRHAFRGLVI